MRSHATGLLVVLLGRKCRLYKALLSPRGLHNERGKRCYVHP